MILKKLEEIERRLMERIKQKKLNDFENTEIISENMLNPSYPSDFSTKEFNVINELEERVKQTISSNISNLGK